MNEEFGDQGILRDYLLGKLEDDVTRSRIELKILSDDEFAIELGTVENNLVEEFLDGELCAEDSEYFVGYFLRSPERKRQLRLTEDLRRFAATARNVPPAKRGSFDWLTTQSFRWPRFAVLAIVVFAVGFGVWRFAISNSDADRGLAQLRYAYQGKRPIESRISAIPDYAPFSETRGPQRSSAEPMAHARAERYLLDAAQDPADSKSHQALALLYLTDKKYDLAIQELKLALSSSPNDASLQNDAGAAYLEISKSVDGTTDGAKVFDLLNDSLNHLDLAISLDPKMPEARFNRALCLQALFSNEQAKTAWEQYLELDPNSQWAEEARRNLKILEENSARERTADELESDYLSAIEHGDEDLAQKLLMGSRELIREKYLPQRLAFSFVKASDEKKDELLRALQFTGRVEMKLTGDPFANEIASFYSTVSKGRLAELKRAQANVEIGYGQCLTSDYESALHSFEDARRTFEQAGDPLEAALAGYFVGYSLINIDRAEDSLKELSNVAKFAHEHGYLWLEATATHWIAGGYVKRKLHTLAKRSFLLALSIAEKINDPYALQRNLIELAKLFSVGGQRQKALTYLYRCLRESGQPGTSQRQRYRNLSDAFWMLSTAKLLVLAKLTAIDSVSVADVTQDQTWISESRNRVGSAFVQTGEMDTARTWLDEGKARAESISDGKVRGRMLAFSALKYGDFERESGNFEESERFYSEAANYYDNAEFPYFREEAHKGLLVSLVALGKNEELESQIPTNIRITEEFREQILDEKERTGFFDSQENIYDIATDFEYKRGNYEAAYDYAESSSSRSLLDWMQKGVSIADRRRDPQFVFAKGAKPLNLSEIREKIPAGVQIIQYSVLPDKIIIWLTSKGKFSVHAVPIESTELENKIDNFLKLSSNRNQQASVERDILGRELYHLLILPIFNELDLDAELCIIPSKSLFGLPFAALVSTDGRALLDDFAIVYAPSASVFFQCSENARKKESSSDKESLVGVGNPRFDRSHFDDLPYLPDAEGEVREIASDYDRSKTLFEESATKKAFLNAVDDADVIHFAGHYVIAQDAPSLSYLLLAGDGNDYDAGVLTNRELAAKKLPHAKLVVLAACQSGTDSYSSSEGMIGLSRTFLAANVPLVVASDWGVDSRATAELMKQFHRFRRSGHMTTTAALRRAQLQMRDDPNGSFNEPYYWAAFAVFGGHAEF